MNYRSYASIDGVHCFPDELSSSYDVVIVGAGTAGCVLANRLSADPGIKVLVLEAGPHGFSPWINVPNGMFPLLKGGRYTSMVETEPQVHLDNRTLFEIRSRVVGGSSSINGIQHARGTAKDYDHWAAFGNLGWSYGDVLPYFKRSESYSAGPSEYRGASGPFHVTRGTVDDPLSAAWIDAAKEAGHTERSDLSSESGIGFAAPDEARRGGRRTSAASAYLKPALRRDNLTLQTETPVRRLLVSGGRCTGVEIAYQGSTRRIAAGTVILSAGVFVSPQLLMLSGIGGDAHLTAHEIETVVDLPGVGRNLKDHLGFQVSYTCPEPITDYRYFKRAGAAGAALRYLVTRRGFLGRSAVRAIGQVCSDIADPDWPDLKLQLVNILLEAPSMQASQHGFLVRVSMMRPCSSGTVTLRSSDPSDHVRIDANYLAEPADLARARSGVRIARTIVEQPAMARYRGKEVSPGPDRSDDASLDAWLRATAGTDSHAVGTCRMGNDAAAVVDARLRVHGVAGLYVIDASIMPDHVGGNTVAPTLMIAEKGADMILESA